jgi:hypothetical protein
VILFFFFINSIPLYSGLPEEKPPSTELEKYIHIVEILGRFAEQLNACGSNAGMQRK